MLKADRQSQILDQLERASTALRIGDLSQTLGVSPVTIRRDVAELSRQGLVLSTRGGVTLLRPRVAFEPAYALKLSADADVKAAIARAAAALVEDGSTIFLDGGTTVGAMVPHLLGRRLTVVSNALNVANMLARSRTIRLIVVGGTYRPESHTFLGPQAVRQMEELRVDTAFMGTEGFSLDRGLEVPDEGDAAFKTAACRAAARIVVMAAGTKLGLRRLYRFARWDDIDVLVSSGPAVAAVEEQLRVYGVETLLVSDPNGQTTQEMNTM